MDEQRLDEILEKVQANGSDYAAPSMTPDEAKERLNQLYKDSLREALQVVHDTFNSDEMQHNDVGFDKWLDDRLAQLNRKEP